MNYLTLTTLESKLVEGLTYTIRKPTHSRRMELRTKIASTEVALRELGLEYQPIQESIDNAVTAAKIEPCTCKHDLDSATDCHDKNGRCTVEGCLCRLPKPDGEAFEKRMELLIKAKDLALSQANPAKVRIFVKSIDGFEIDGVPATVESFLAEAPDDLLEEVGSLIDKVLTMTMEEQLAFKSPTTLDAAVDGKTLSSPAPLAATSSST
jgi:hypothetical protein